MKESAAHPNWAMRDGADCGTTALSGSAHGVTLPRGCAGPTSLDERDGPYECDRPRARSTAEFRNGCSGYRGRCGEAVWRAAGGSDSRRQQAPPALSLPWRSSHGSGCLWCFRSGDDDGQLRTGHAARLPLPVRSDEAGANVGPAILIACFRWGCQPRSCSANHGSCTAGVGRPLEDNRNRTGSGSPTPPVCAGPGRPFGRRGARRLG